MKTSMTWSPAAGLNVVSVEPGEQAWTVTVDSQQSTFCPGCGTQVETEAEVANDESVDAADLEPIDEEE